MQMIPDQLYLKLPFAPEEVNVSRETFMKIEAYANLLKKWNKSMNLTSRKLPDTHLIKYFKEAIFLGQILNKRSKILDFGSGNGLPGVILSIMNLNITLIERNIKKAVFLKELTRTLGLTAHVINSDIKNSYKTLIEYNCDCIISKAVSRSKEIIDLCLPIVTEKTEFYLLKNIAMLKEIEDLKEKYYFESVVIENKNVDDTVILKIGSIKLKK